MNRILLIGILVGSFARVHAQPAADVQVKARALVESGLEHFNKGEYALAYKDLLASYELVPSAATAALASQAQVNVDRSHPSKAIIWLRNWVKAATSEPIDGKGWKAVQRAHDAVIAAAVLSESEAENLRAEKEALQAEMSKLKVELQVLKRKFKIFESALAPELRERIERENLK